MENRRFILLAVIAALVFLLWQSWQQDHDPSYLASLKVAPATPARAGDVTLGNDVLRLLVSPRGADIEQADLLKFSRTQGDPRRLELLSREAGNFNRVASGVNGATGALAGEDTPWQLVGHTPGAATFAATGPGWRVEKTWSTKPGSYDVGLAWRVQNTGRLPLAVAPVVGLLRTHPPVAASRSSAGFSGLGWYENDDGSLKYREVAYGSLSEKPFEKPQTGGWIAQVEHYFVTAIVPRDANTWTYVGKQTDRGLLAQAQEKLVTVPPGGETRFAQEIYIGPKTASLDSVAPGLNLTNGSGFWATIGKLFHGPFYWMLTSFHRVVGNWGLAIVLLTVVIKLVLYPLTKKQYTSMARMKQFAPRLQEINERFAGDPQARSQAMMALYKKEGFNPLAGCWPMLAQFPVFIALYSVIQNSVELRHAPLFGWVQDLSAPDPLFLLPVLFGASMWAQQRLSGQAVSMDPTQAKMMQVMPIVMTAFFAFFPAGLVLYWFVSNLIGIAQQWVITRNVVNHPHLAKPANDAKGGAPARPPGVDRPRPTLAKRPKG